MNNIIVQKGYDRSGNEFCGYLTSHLRSIAAMNMHKEQQFYSLSKDATRLPGNGTEDKNHKHSSGGNCRDVNIAVLGAKGVGKSAMIVRFLTGRFIGDYDPDMEAIFSSNLSVEGKHYCVHIMDTVNHLSCNEIKEDPVTWADGFLLVFSLTDVTSYRKVQELIHSLRKARDDDRIPIAVAANKSDLVHFRAVSAVDSETWAKDQGFPFCEVSTSEDPDSVTSAFISLFKHIRAMNKKRDKLSKTLQRPAVAAKLQIRQSLRNLAERKWRSRTFTF